MEPRRVLTASGAGVTTFLLVTVAVIELLDFEFSAIIGLPVGLLAGLVALVVLWVRLSALGPSVRRAVGAYATFGLTVLGLLALRYVDIGRGVFSTTVITGIGAVTAVLAYIVLPSDSTV
jgi:hypothetical protein